MKFFNYCFLLAALLLGACQSEEPEFDIATEQGTIRVKLYNETPKHRDNFKKLVTQGFYNDLLFHRVLNQFMIQGGDPTSKAAPLSKTLGTGGPGYTLDAEIDKLHFKGALAAARQGDAVNPKRKSSGSQFYIVQGVQNISDDMLDKAEETHGRKYTPEERAKYKEIGGYPFLDNQYTVFGEVVSGLDVVDKIASQPVNNQARPIKDIKMSIK